MRTFRCKMELLIRIRPILIAGFFLALIGIGVGAYFDNRRAFAGTTIAAHICLFLFTTTESFGRVAQTRARTARILARVFFGMYALAGVGFVISSVSALRHG